VALGIASFALVALMGRLGSSSEIQRSLSLYALSMDTARNVLANDSLSKNASESEKNGTVEVDGALLHWRLWTEKTPIDMFVRRNVSVSVGNEPEVSLFQYRAK